MSKVADQEFKTTNKWGHNRRFNAYSNYFKAIFGGRVQKVSVDAGFTCPNRDGSKGVGGCTFCNNKAFSPSYCKPQDSITFQINEGIDFHKKRYRRSVGYLAYFQSYTNTYSSIDHLEKLYNEALEVPDILGLVIGTRPDAIDNDKLDLLKQLNKKFYITVEYGLESVYDKTLDRVNRCHTFQESVDAINNTVDKGILCGAHFIFGLPGESREDMLNSAELISKLPIKTAKFHQLQIFKDTIMESEYQAHPSEFQLFTWEEYQEFFIKFLERLTPAIVLERFTGEAPPAFIKSPRWGKVRADGLIAEFETRLEKLNTWQGRLYKENN